MSTTRPPHPVLYTFLIVPFGVVGGFVTVAMAFLATRRGLTVEDGATLIAAGMLPHTWKFFWAPVADMTFTRKQWYVATNVLCAVGLFAMGAIPLGPATLHLLQGLIFVVNLATTFLGMAVEGLMAHATPPEERGRVGGWFQAGNLGGSGIGGGIGLWLATHVSQPWVAGAGEALLCLACILALRGVPEVREVHAGSVGGAVVQVLRDLWGIVRSRPGILCATLCFLPIGTGAAAGVLAQAEVAQAWGAGEAEVGMVNGFAAGAVSAFGCFVGGEICARLHARWAYALFGALMAAVTGAMALAPMTPVLFVVFGLVYSFVTGLAYAAFTGLVLDTIGTGAAATKYNIFAALSNTPITYMGLLLASVMASSGATSMLWAESGAGIAGIVIFFVVYAALRPRAVAA